jgi:hypothetical protein
MSTFVTEHDSDYDDCYHDARIVLLGLRSSIDLLETLILRSEGIERPNCCL